MQFYSTRFCSLKPEALRYLTTEHLLDDLLSLKKFIKLKNRARKKTEQRELCLPLNE